MEARPHFQLDTALDVLSRYLCRFEDGHGAFVQHDETTAVVQVTNALLALRNSTNDEEQSRLSEALMLCGADPTSLPERLFGWLERAANVLVIKAPRPAPTAHPAASTSYFQLAVPWLLLVSPVARLVDYEVPQNPGLKSLVESLLVRG